MLTSAFTRKLALDCPFFELLGALFPVVFLAQKPEVRQVVSSTMHQGNFVVHLIGEADSATYCAGSLVPGEDLLADLHPGPAASARLLDWSLCLEGCQSATGVSL